MTKSEQYSLEEIAALTRPMKNSVAWAAIEVKLCERGVRASQRPGLRQEIWKLRADLVSPRKAKPEA
jgi:hypothetical protein